MTVRGEFFPPGDCSGKLHECSAVFFSLVGVSTPPVYPWAWRCPGICVSSFQEREQRGRIKTTPEFL